MKSTSSGRIGALMAWVVVVGASITVGCMSGGIGDNRSIVDAPDVEQVKLVVYGSTIASPAGSSCDLATWHYTLGLDAATRTLSWNSCALNSTTRLAAPDSGTCVITDAQLATVRGDVAQISLSQAKNCGADGPVMTLDVRTTHGLGVYVDDFYSGCPWSGQEKGREYVHWSEIIPLEDDLSMLITSCKASPTRHL
jgi:hypothetical protein